MAEGVSVMDEDELVESFWKPKPAIQDLKSREKTEIKSIKDIKIGHEIGIKRFGYKHHAVVISKDERRCIVEIVHISGTIANFVLGFSSSATKASVGKQIISISELETSGIFLYDYGKASFPENVVVNRAVSVYENFTALGQNYHALTFNCQHLASYIVTGVMFSRKAEPNKITFDKEYMVDMILFELEVNRIQNKTNQEHIKSNNGSQEESRILSADELKGILKDGEPEEKKELEEEVKIQTPSNKTTFPKVKSNNASKEKSRILSADELKALLKDGEPEEEKELEEVKIHTHSNKTAFEKGTEEDLTTRIVVVCQSVSVMSEIENLILGSSQKYSEIFPNCPTRQWQTEKTYRGKSQIKLVSLSNLFDETEIANCIRTSLPGPHVFLIVLKANGFIFEELFRLKRLFDLFGDDLKKFVIVAFMEITLEGHCNYTLQKYVYLNTRLRAIIRYFGFRYFKMDYSANSWNQKSTQETLVDMIEEITKQNGSCYNNSIFQYANAKLRKIKAKNKKFRAKINSKSQQQLFDLREEYELLNDKRTIQIENQKKIQIQKQNTIVELKKLRNKSSFLIPIPELEMCIVDIWIKEDHVKNCETLEEDLQRKISYLKQKLDEAYRQIQQMQQEMDTQIEQFRKQQMEDFQHQLIQKIMEKRNMWNKKE